VIKLENQNSGFSVSHNVVLSVTDGETGNPVTSVSSAQVFYVCGASPKTDESCTDKILKRNVDITTYRFWVLILHVQIRFFKYLFQVSLGFEIKMASTKTII
jgi:hypothetical protein